MGRLNEPLQAASVRCGWVPVAGDVSGDGQVSAKDAVLLQRFIAGGYGVTLE